MTANRSNLIDILRKGGVAVLLTDTIYGLVGRALNKDTVNRIYEIKKRAPAKPCIILISDIADLSRFSISLSDIQKEKIKELWPGPVSLILDCAIGDLEYLHRGTQTLAFRLPGDERLRALLSRTGPLIAPSANPEGLTPAENISQAREYFGEAVDAYEDGGEIGGKPSKIVKLHKDGFLTIIRE